MTSFDRLLQIKFNSSELAAILSDEKFDYLRAGRWMDDHILFSMQAVVLYVFTIFTIKRFMKDREPLKLQLPILIWNFSIAIVSGLCAASMTEEYFESTLIKGFNASLCSTRKEFFSGTNGFAVFVFLFARILAFSDTLFIVLRKQPLHFFHWYHHAFTLYISWFGYSGASPSSRHAIYFNAVVHTALYSYFFLTSINIRPPKFIGRWIMMAEILHFFFILYALIHVTYLTHVLKEPCQIELYSLVITWFMDLSYLYLFIDYFMKLALALLTIFATFIEGYPVAPSTPIPWQEERHCSSCYFSMTGKMSLGSHDFIKNHLYNDGLNPLSNRDFDQIEKTEASMMLCRVICAVTENGGQYQVETRQKNDRQARSSSRSQSKKVNARNEYSDEN